MASGTPQWLNADGVKLFPDRDCNANLPGGLYENEPMPNSGGNTQKKLRSASSMTGFTFTAAADKHAKLQSINDRTFDYPLSWKDINGNIWRTVGFITYQSMETADNKGTVDMHPGEGQEGWALFEA